MPSLPFYAVPHLLISEQLRHAPLFAALPKDRGDCFAILREGALFDVSIGQQIVAIGEAPALVVVTSGCVRDSIGQRSWADGSYFGVAESLACRPFAAAITTVAQTRLYRLDGPLLRSLMTLCPAIADRMLDELSPQAQQLVNPYAM